MPWSVVHQYNLAQKWTIAIVLHIKMSITSYGDHDLNNYLLYYPFYEYTSSVTHEFHFIFVHAKSFKI